MSRHIHHAHLKASGFYDGQLLIDGEPFPFDIRSVRYRLAADETSIPTLIVEFTADRITIEHQLASSQPEWVRLEPIDGKVPIEDGWNIRRTYTVGEPGETVERLLFRKETA